MVTAFIAFVAYMLLVLVVACIMMAVPNVELDRGLKYLFVGYAKTDTYNYVCVFPTLVFKFQRRTTT